LSERADYFDVQHPFLLGALDRFAQFFLCPLFSESATEREMKAVDSENSKNLQSDAWRLQQLLKGAADPRHPWSRFNVGSIETLSDKLERYVRLELSTASVPATRGSAQPQPGAEGGGSAANVATASVHASVRAKHVPALKVRRTLIDFHSRHYSANLMTVAILGRECLDTLAQWAVPLFATVPDQKLPRPKFDVEPYPLSRLNNYYRIVPVKNFSSLTVTWALPPITEQVHSKPFRYVSHLLGHESEGSLLSLLKKLAPPKSKLDLIFDHDEPYLESNIRSDSDIFEAMQDEFSFLVPVSLMMSMRTLKIESA
jgi:insulysin